jgi:hypothetical protein
MDAPVTIKPNSKPPRHNMANPLFKMFFLRFSGSLSQGFGNPAVGSPRMDTDTLAANPLGESGV